MVDLDSFVEVTFKDDSNFLKIKETLTRIGIVSKKILYDGVEYNSISEAEKATGDHFSMIKKNGEIIQDSNVLTQSCHILHKKGKFYIVHFKELFKLDGKQTDFTDEDKGRRNSIAKLLEEWGLLEIVNPKVVQEPRAPLSNIKIIPHKEKSNWELVTKYSLGKKKR